MSKLELKAAMELLQVKKPLKLQGRHPQFKVPPTISETTLVPAETPVDLRTQVAATTEVHPQTMVAETTVVVAPTEVGRATPVPGETQVAIETKVVPQTQAPLETVVPHQTTVDLETPVLVPTLVAAPTTVPSQTKEDVTDQDVLKSASNQDSSVTLAAQTAPKLHQGYTRLPNNILMRMAGGDLIRSEMQILLLIARFTISFQRRHAPLSKSVLERQTGLRGPAVLQAISDLLAKGLIEKIPGNQHRPNQLGLVFEDDWDFFPKTKIPTSSTMSAPLQTPVATPTMVPRSTLVAVVTPVVVGTAALVSAPTPAVVAGATYFKDIETIENKNSLSRLPEKLRQYFDGLKPTKKRESEWKAFENLKGDYSVEDISDCVSYLQTRGVGGDEGQPCHSPLAFLGKAIAEILVEVEKNRRKASERADREQREALAERQRVETEARDAQEVVVWERAFDKMFPGEDQQLKMLAELLRGLPFRPDSRVGIASDHTNLTQFMRSL